MSPSVTTYVCDGCGREIDYGKEDVFWIKFESFGSNESEREFFYGCVHNAECAAAYFTQRAAKESA